ncbi:MAG: T9SS type A sorting domain-containing protein [Candidatus Kapabacteria bacterium]|nr:T9SS type A sorting domain-containing protein [Candidatus Kapabacteria bacterium]
MKYLIFIFLLFLILFESSKSLVFQDSCLNEGVVRFHDSTLVLHYKLSIGNISADTETISINYIDFTPKNEQIIIGTYKLGIDIKTYNVILIKRENKWEVFLNDSNKLIYDKNLEPDPYKNSYTARKITGYKIQGDYIYLLCGGLGTLDILDSKTLNPFNLNTAYIIKINMYNQNDKTQIFLSNDYYATDIFFRDDSWIVTGLTHIYWFNSTFLYSYKAEIIKPNEINEYAFISAYPVSKDSVYLLFAQDKYNRDSSKIDYRLYFTSDGAKSFTRVTTPLKKTGGLFFTDSKTGYYSGEYADSSLRIYSKIFKTNDGGLTWTSIFDFKTFIIKTKSQNLQYSSDLRFFNNGRIKLFGSAIGSVYISNDYGANWNQLNIFKDSACYNNNYDQLGHFNWFTYYKDILYIPYKDYYNYTYFTYSNPSLLDVTTNENNSKYDLSTSKLLVKGDYFYIKDIKDIFKNSNYEIYNLTGEILNCQKYENNKIDISFLNSGTYILRIENKTFIFIKAD